MVPTGPLSQPDQEEGAGPGYRTHAHAGRQLVQEPEAEGQGCGSKEQVSHVVCKTVLSTDYLFSGKFH